MIRAQTTAKTVILPLVVFIITSMIAFCLYTALAHHEAQYTRNVITEQVKKIKLLIESQTNSKLLALQHMAHRWEAADGTPQLQWQKDAADFINTLNGLKTMEWVDSTYHVRWAEPLAGNEKAIGLNVLFDKAREDALRGAAERSSITVTPPLDLIQGYKAFIAYAPVKIKGKFDGFITGIFAVNEFFGGVISEIIAGDFYVTLKHDDKAFFQKIPAQSTLDNSFTTEQSIQVYDQKWVVTATPTRRFVSAQLTWMPSIVLTAGLLIALLLALIVRDTIQRKLMEKVLRESELRHRLLVDGVADYGIYWLDVEGRVSSWNHGACNLKGYTADEIIGKHFSHFFTGEDVAQQLPNKILAEAKNTGHYHGEGWRVRKDGTRFWANIQIEPIRDDSAAIIGYAKVSHDETERRAAAQALKRSEEGLQLGWQGTGVGMWDWNVITNQIVWSDRFNALLGYAPDELAGRYEEWEQRLHKDDKDATVAAVEDYVSRKAPAYDREYRLITKSGEWRWFHATGKAIWDAEGRPQRMVGSLDDITERKQVERMKSDFMAMVTHELRTPVTSIKGALGLMKTGIVGEMPTKAKQMTEVAYANSERLILLINDILDVEKFESGEMRFDMQAHDLGNVIKQAVDANEGYGKNFAVRYVIESFITPATVSIDSNRFIQVLSNLLSNAAKFSPSGEEVHIAVNRHDTALRISIIDKGPGIPEEFRSRIFGKFAQAATPSANSKGGTGLGLNITKQIIEHMNGKIGFISEIGHGTTFWIELPEISQHSE